MVPLVLWPDSAHRDVRWWDSSTENMGVLRQEDALPYPLLCALPDNDNLCESSSAFNEARSHSSVNLVAHACYVQMIVITAKALELVPWFIVGQTRGRCITAGFSGNQLATGFWVAPLGLTISGSA